MVGGGDGRVVWKGDVRADMRGPFSVNCSADMSGLFSVVVGVMTSLSFKINPPSTNFQIVCRRKDRGGCGCSRRWP